MLGRLSASTLLADPFCAAPVSGYMFYGAVSLMHEYQIIKQKLVPVLNRAGLNEAVADRTLDVYGSVYSIFASDVARIMVGWDGEEGFGYAETWEGNNVWRMLSSTVPEGSADEFAADIEALTDELSRHLGAGIDGAP